MDMLNFTSVMLDAIAHCAIEVQCASEWRQVCAADMRDAYDLLSRKLARHDAEPAVQAKGVLISMALDDNISELQQLLASRACETQIGQKVRTILTAIDHLRR